MFAAISKLPEERGNVSISQRVWLWVAATLSTGCGHSQSVSMMQPSPRYADGNKSHIDALKYIQAVIVNGSMSTVQKEKREILYADWF